MYMHMIPTDFVMPRHETIPCPNGMTHKQYLAVTVEHTKPWHENCQHALEQPSRMGETHCGLCGAVAWSAQWVKPDVMGDIATTEQWTIMLAGHYEQMVCTDLLTSQLGAQVIREEPVTQPEQINVIVALNDADAPARRPGIPVPKMAYGVTS